MKMEHVSRAPSGYSTYPTYDIYKYDVLDKYGKLCVNITQATRAREMAHQ